MVSVLPWWPRSTTVLRRQLTQLYSITVNPGFLHFYVPINPRSLPTLYHNGDERFTVTRRRRTQGHTPALGYIYRRNFITSTYLRSIKGCDWSPGDSWILEGTMILTSVYTTFPPDNCYRVDGKEDIGISGETETRTGVTDEVQGEIRR